jgi:hypothetical protein
MDLDTLNDRFEKRPKNNWRFDRHSLTRSEVDKFLHGIRRFRLRTDNILTVIGDAGEAREIRQEDTDGSRSGSDRRCGFDTRSEIEQFLHGQSRSGLDRRSRRKGYRSFKRARAFARGLGLKSVGEWRSYTKSCMRPGDIPVAPQHIYANDGWAGWNDWLGC